MERKHVKETSITQILVRTGMIFFVALFIAFLVMYIITKQEFEKRTDAELSSVTEIVKQSITSTQNSTKMLENLTDLRLYTISKMIGEELKGKTAAAVSDEELLTIKEKWGLSEISLFVRQNDDLIVVKSTDEKEIGLNAKDWGYWYTAMIELFEGKEVSVEKGYREKNYWVGPLSLSEVVNKHYKYAYYYDGTTDFMINAYVEADNIYELIQTRGTAQLIEKIQEGYRNLDEVAVINIEAYLKGEENRIIEPLTDMPVLYGFDKTRVDEDTDIFREALVHTVFKKVQLEQDGKKLEKIYISLPEKRILTAVMNVDEQSVLMKNLLLLFTIVFIVTVFGIFLFSRMVTGKTLKLIKAERERLRVAEDFKRTMEILPSAIYKCVLTEDNNYRAVYSEGTLMEEMDLTTEKVKGQLLQHIVDEALYNEVLPVFQLACKEGRAECTLAYNHKTYQHVIQAIYSIDDPTEVIEVAGYAVDITELTKAHEEIRYTALHDSLTSLPNRTYFHQMLSQSLQNRTKGKVAVLFIDLDNFKQINDTLGHEAGDLLLQEVTGRLQQCLGERALLSRMGGDEFTALLPSCYDREEVEKLCQEITSLLKQPFFIFDHELFVTASIGASLAPDDGLTSHTLLKNADIAMYSSKQNGKSSYQFYIKDMESQNVRRIEVQQDLRQSLQGENQFFLFYQPQLSLETNEIVGVEALLRWKHPMKGLISPAEFIPIAEESGLIEPLGDWILREACRQFIVWQEQGMAPMRMSVNLSARQFRQQHLEQKICEILAETGMPPHYLNLDITESTSMENISHTIELIEKLRSLGISVSIDDFGTGYSSLNYLKDFPINHLKIDQTFVRELHMDAADRAIVKSIIDLALNLDLQVIAEGVETKEQLAILKQMGCHEIQGYYFSRPIEPEKVQDLLLQHSK